MKVFLREDHDQALKIWQKAKVKGLDLIHVDAHFDFAVYPARDPLEVFNSATSIKELTAGLEYTLAYLDYERDLYKQTDIGNYIYPAMHEGLVRDFWWVVPGDARYFERNFKQIKGIFRRSFGGQRIKVIKKARGLACAEFLGRRFWACVLGTLPVFERRVLLDIDIDFLVESDRTRDIGKRQHWITPLELKDKLAAKIKTPEITTIAYSTNGGFTPMCYRHFGDELAYCFYQRGFARRFRRAKRAAAHFRAFGATGRSWDYWSAVRSFPAYRREDNNYGPLYLEKNLIGQAQKELNKILRVDPDNPAALKNMAVIFLRNKKYRAASGCFKAVLKQKGLAQEVRQQALFGLAQAYVKLHKPKEAQGLFLRHKRILPLYGQTRYCLARIYEARKDHWRAAQNYRHSLRLNFGGVDALEKLIRLSFKLAPRRKRSIIDYVVMFLAGIRTQAKNTKEFKNKLKTVKRLLKEAKTLDR